VTSEATTSAPPARPGCLTDAQIDEVRTAPAGKVPEDLAAHLAGCERCQERALFGAERASRKLARGAPQFPSLRRALLLLALVLVAVGAFLYTLMKLAGRI